MLVLSRKAGERIRIGDDIEIVVLELGRDQVRLGITAPRSVAVHRQEVYTEIVEANRLASGELAPAPSAPMQVEIVVPVTPSETPTAPETTTATTQETSPASGAPTHAASFTGLPSRCRTRR